MAAAVNVGTGTTLTNHGWTAQLIDVQLTGATREAFNTSHMGTTHGGGAKFGGHTHMPGDLADPGELTATFHFDPDLTPPLNAAAAGIIITFPEANTFTCSGFMTSFEVNTPLEDVMTATGTWKLTGDCTIA